MKKWEKDCELIINSINNNVKNTSIKYIKSPKNLNDIEDEDSTHPSVIISSSKFSDQELEEKLAEGNPSIRVRNGFEYEGIKIITSNFHNNEAEIVADKLIKILS